jgi:hypothetical protein
MNEKEILKRKALIRDQAASLLRQDAERHESEAQRLREEASLLEDQYNEKT